MIATLTGVISEKLSELVVLDVAGVGYGLNMPLEDYSTLQNGEKTRVYVYEHIRESSHDLYAFTKPDSKAMFELLLSVNGVGSRMAINILNIGNSGEVRLAIAEGNTKYIQAANGVGKRVAERVVVDLKDKVGLASTDDATTFLQSPSANSDEAMQALMALGFEANDAAKALDGIDPKLQTEERVKLALKGRR